MLFRVISFILFLFFQQSLSAADKPNIVLIFADDMGAMDLGCYGSDLYRTPNIDRLAREGVRFTQAYAAAHVCSPTRASLMTGKYPARVRLTDFLKGHKRPFAKLNVPDWTTGLPQSETSLAEILKPQGYATAWLGKWHLGEGAQDHGFDAGNQRWIENTKKDPKDPKGVFTLNKEAIGFIEKHRSQPFFVALSHYSPHGPLRFEPTLRDEYQKIIDEKKPRQTNADYAAMIEALDASVGQMLAWLDKNNLAENTLVIFYSDNGGELRFTNNSPLRGGKGSLYEGGVRVPMIVRWPGKIPAGATTETRFCSIDLLPTLAAITGSQVPVEVDGRDLSAAFKDSTKIDRGSLYWHYPHYHNTKPSGAILKGEWKLIEWFESGETELYHLTADPAEEKNLAATNSEKSAELLADLKVWRERVGAQMMTPNPDYDPAKEHQGEQKKSRKKADSKKNKEKRQKDIPAGGQSERQRGGV